MPGKKICMHHLLYRDSLGAIYSRTQIVFGISIQFNERFQYIFWPSPTRGYPFKKTIAIVTAVIFKVAIGNIAIFFLVRVDNQITYDLV